MKTSFIINWAHRYSLEPRRLQYYMKFVIWVGLVGLVLATLIIQESMLLKKEPFKDYSTYNNNNFQNNDDHPFGNFSIDDNAINLVNNHDIIGSSRVQSFCPFGNYGVHYTTKKSLLPFGDGVDYSAKKEIIDTESNHYIEQATTYNTDFDPSGSDFTNIVDELIKYTVPDSNDTNKGLRYTTGPIIHPNASLNELSITANTNRETVFLNSEEVESRDIYINEPWKFNFGTTTPTKSKREKFLSRFKEKRRLRDYGKKIRYTSRKSRADNRKREKGRFVKAAEEQLDSHAHDIN